MVSTVAAAKRFIRFLPRGCSDRSLRSISSLLHHRASTRNRLRRDLQRVLLEEGHGNSSFSSELLPACYGNNREYPHSCCHPARAAESPNDLEPHPAVHDPRD